MNYLLIGPEEYLKAQFLEKLKKSILNKTPSGLDCETFQAGASEITEILNSSKTLPFFSKHRIILIKDTEKFSSGEKDALLKYLKSPLDSTTLVLSSSSNALDKFLSEASRLAKVIRCNSLKPGELNYWIRKQFEERKKKISPSLARLIIERTGEELLGLKNEIEKIVSFAKDTGEITPRHIETSLGEAASETAFELVDLILKKKLNKVFLSVDRVLLKERPHRILSLLAWRFRNLEGSFAKRDLKRKFEIILEGDLSIKRGTVSPEDALFRVLVRLCS